MVVAGVVIVLFGVKTRPGYQPGASVLPEVNAVLNGMCGVCLLLGFAFARKRQLLAHKACMVTAATFAATFLVTYLLHNAKVGSVPFLGQGATRYLYFGLLIPHATLAAVVTPLAMTTLYRGAKDHRERHKKIARVTLPLWLFVSVSGVAVYLLLYHVGR